MKCHSHMDRDAIAICTRCTKGLCADCAIDQPGGTACGDECSAAIAISLKQLVAAKRTFQLQRLMPAYLGGFLTIVGFIFSTLGAVESEPGVRNLLLVFGVTFLACGLVSIAVWRRFRRNEE